MTDTQDAPVTDETASAAGGSNGEATEPKTKRSQLDDLPIGPMKTRTGAEATVIQGPQGKRVFTAGGDKGAKIAELLRTRTDLPRKEIAAMVGCSQSRVAEVARVLGLAAPRPKPAATEGDATADAPAEASAPAEAPTSVST